MNGMNKRKQVIGVIGGAGLTLLFYVNVLNLEYHMVAGTGSLALGIPLAITFSVATGFFGYLTVKKARYLSRH